MARPDESGEGGRDGERAPAHVEPDRGPGGAQLRDEVQLRAQRESKLRLPALGGSGGLGENIAAGAPSLTIASANSGWIGEDANYDYTSNTCNTGAMMNLECGHYTQIVWKTTTSVGCALVTCTTNSPFPAQYGTSWGFAVCDYAPPGNIVPQGARPPNGHTKSKARSVRANRRGL